MSPPIFCHRTNNLWTLSAIIKAKFAYIPFLLPLPTSCSCLVRKKIQKHLNVSIQAAKSTDSVDQLSHKYSPNCTVWCTKFPRSSSPPNVGHKLAPMVAADQFCFLRGNWTFNTNLKLPVDYTYHISARWHDTFNTGRSTDHVNLHLLALYNTLHDGQSKLCHKWLQWVTLSFVNTEV